MSSLAEHDAHGVALGVLAGVLDALASSTRRLSLAELIAAGVGGAMGGKVGSRIPDTLEPATSSWHRSTAHSLAATSCVAYAGLTRTRTFSSRLHQTADTATDDAEQLLARFFAGAAVGVPAGYVSHSLADSQTPRGIPLLTRGF